MSLDRRAPVPLGRVQAWGPSRHGLVQHGTLTLGNGQTMPWPQPWARSLSQPWTAADTLLVRRPGWVPPPIPPAQAALLAANGHELLDYAVLSGYGHAYGKQALSTGWLAFDDSGACWWYRYAGQAGPNTAVVYTFQRRRFGLIDGSGALAEATLTTAPFDLGQTGAPTYNYYRDDYAPPVIATLSDDYNPTPILVSTTTDGRRSLWMLSVRSAYRGPRRWSTCADKPVAFFEIAVNADGSLSAQRLKSRAECMGVYSSSGTGGGASELVGIDWGLSSLGSESCGATGLREFRNYYAAVRTGPGALTNDVYPEVESTRERNGMVLAMWYDADSTLHTLTADVEYTYIRHVDAGITGAPSTVEYKGACSDPSGGGESWAGALDLGHRVQYDVTERSRVTVRDNGTDVAALSCIIERTAESTETMTLRFYPPSDWTYRAAAQCSSTLTVNGEVVHSYTNADEPWSEKFDMLEVSSSLNATLAGGTLLTSPALIFPVWQSNLREKAEHEIDLVRWSNHALGATVATPAPDAPGDRVRTFGSVVTPGGLIAHTLTLPPAPSDTRYTVSGSWRPVRNQFAASVSVDDGVTPHAPCCWV